MKRHLRNLLLLGLGDAGSRLLGFLVTVYLARILEPSGFGIMSIGLAVLGYLGLVGSPGIQVLEARNVARLTGVDVERVGGVLSFRLALALVLWGGAIVGADALIEHELTRNVVILFAASVVPLALMLDWFFQGKEDFLSVALSKLLNYSTYGILVVLLVHGTEGLLVTAVAFGAGNIAGMTVLWLIYRRKFGPVGMRWSPEVWKDIARSGVPVGIAMLLAHSATNLPPLVIGLLISSFEVGLYTAAMKLIFFLLLFDRLLNALFLPVATRYFTSRPLEVPRLAAMTLKVVAVAALPVVVLGIVGAPMAVSIVLGGGYIGAIPIFQVLMGFFLFTLLNSVYMGILIGAGREKEYTRNTIRGSIILTLLIVVLTYSAGSIGAGIAVVVGEFATLTLMMLAARKVVTLPFGEAFARPLAACATMGIAAYLCRDLSTLVVMAIALTVYVVSTMLFKGITRTELRFLQERFV